MSKFLLQSLSTIPEFPWEIDIPDEILFESQKEMERFVNLHEQQIEEYQMHKHDGYIGGYRNYKEIK